MANPVPASFLTRTNALFRKNLTYQKRNIWSNVRLIVIPFYLCVLLVFIQALFDTQVNNSPDNRCGCKCIDDKNGDGQCERKRCGLEYSSQTQAFFCAFQNPPPLLPLLHIPRPETRSVDRTRRGSCRRIRSCPVTILVTGNNPSLGATLLRNLLSTSFPANSSDLFLHDLAYNVLGTTSEADYTNYLDPGTNSDLPIFNIQPRCTPTTRLSSFSFQQPPLEFHKEVRCVQGLNQWRNNSIDVNKEIFMGYRQGNHEEIINEVVAAYDLLDTDRNNFFVTIWYNSTYKGDLRDRRVMYVRVPRSVNLVSNAYLQYLRGAGTKILFDFVKEMPKQETRLRLDMASLIGPLFFTWVILLLFPVILNSLVYEKQHRLRIIMKMHGLGNEVRCVQGLNLWRNNSIDVNKEIFMRYRQGNHKEIINEVVAAYDLLNTNRNNFNVTIWYYTTYKGDLQDRRVKFVRVPRSVNLVSNAYLHFLQGAGTNMLFDFVKEMPKPETRLRMEMASLIGPIFFTWVILLLFPVILTSLVYEKQQRLRIIMKMHGLGNGPYWMISYAYFLAISTLYVVCLMIFGSLIGLKFFRFNDYSVQLVFYFLCINLQISIAFLLSSAFSKVETASVVAYIYVFGSGLLGAFLFQFLMEGLTFPRRWIFVMELYPGFSLYRGLYEFSQFAFQRNLNGRDGIKWKDVSGRAMDEVFSIIIAEWFAALVAAYYIDRLSLSAKDPLYFLKTLFKKSPSLQKQGSVVSVKIEKLDVAREREKVEKLMLESSISHSIVCDNLKKVYPGRDGNPPKMAVCGLSLAVSSGECFGMLGPNGAGKTSFINMMTGLVKPTSGSAFVQGLELCKDMDRVYTNMGVCLQHDLLWETLTGREHLLFYGRLKNLKGSDLKKAVQESLKSVNLFHRGVADKPAGKYSGGMKRRLSVAISLIGNPKVVYMDEPSTGLDPASRKNLWTVIKRAKQNTAIILTTHSMEEAEFLCDRLGIFVDGSLQCIGNPKELKGRYGGSYVFTMTTSSEHEQNVEELIQDVSPNAKKIYHIAGTQKFELPKEEVRISVVFQAVEKAKSNFTVFAWGLADTTLEDVFIKVASTGVFS